MLTKKRVQFLYRYSYDDALELTNYALLRGVRIVPELDTPMHAANGWQFGPDYGLGDLALCVNLQEDRCRGGVCGVMNPINPETYNALRSAYADLFTAFPSEAFHMGGDEVKFDCWRADPGIQAWFSDQGLAGNDEDMYSLWGMFQKNASEAIQEANGNVKKKLILWSSTLTDREDSADFISPEDYAIQIWAHTDVDWTGPIRRGYDVIVGCADKWYFDCGTGSWATLNDTLPCSPYNQWREMYEFNIGEEYLASEGSDAGRLQQILGNGIAAIRMLAKQ